MTHQFARPIKRFLSHYLPIQKGVSTNTVLAYRDTVKLLVCYTADTLRKPADRLLVEDVSENVVADFLDYLEKKRGCCARTRNVRLAAIRSLFSFIGRDEPELLEQCRRVRAIPIKRTQHKTIDYLEEKEMKCILGAIPANTRTSIRDRALLLLLYNTGARVSEIVGLKSTDLSINNSVQVRLLGKGNKHRNCPLWPETVAALKECLKQRNPKNTKDKTVFLNANSVPVTRFGIRHILRKYARIAEDRCPSIRNKIVNPHTIRHTTAMHLLRSGNDINMVSYWLGHADLNTTHIYIEIDMEMKRKMLERASAPNIRKRPSWHKPEVLQWLDQIQKKPELCAANR